MMEPTEASLTRVVLEAVAKHAAQAWPGAQAANGGTGAHVTHGGTAAQAAHGGVGGGPAARYGEARLVDAGSGVELAHSRLAELVPAAAAGLAQRGLHPGDVAAVQAAGAVRVALGLHAVATAGAVPVPVPAELDAAELAEALTRTGARVLLADAACLPTALRAADSSYVRQVFGFGIPPGGAATPFEELTKAPPVPRPRRAQPSTDGAQPALRTRRGRYLTHAERLADLHRMAGLVQLGPGDVVVSHAAWCPPETWATLIDVTLISGATLVAAPTPDSLPAVLTAHSATVAVLPKNTDLGPDVPPIRLLPLPLLTEE